MTVFEHEIDASAPPTECASCSAGFGAGVAFLGVCFVVWTRACIDIEMINALSMLRRSNESLSTELKEAREESLRWRRNSL